MKLLDIGIAKSPVMVGSWALTIEVQGPTEPLKFTGYFDDFGGFMMAVREAATFFAVRLGRIKSDDANRRLLTRPLAKNPSGSIQ